MIITAEISMYPLEADYKPAIRGFIARLNEPGDVEVVTNQLSTQVRGEFDAVTGAVQGAMKTAMGFTDKVVFVVKYLSADLPISEQPDLAGPAR